METVGSTGLAVLKETVCSLRSTWQTREQATRGSSHAPLCHPNTHYVLVKDEQSRKCTFILTLLNPRVQRGAVICCSTIPGGGRRDPWLWIGKQGQANKSHEPTLGARFPLCASFPLSISKHTKLCGTALTVEQTTLRNTEWSNSKAVLDNAWMIFLDMKQEIPYSKFKYLVCKYLPPDEVSLSVFLLFTPYLYSGGPSPWGL